MSEKLDRLRASITPSTEAEAQERMRAYEAEKTPGFVPAENEIYESLDVAGAVRAMTDEEARALVAEATEAVRRPAVVLDLAARKAALFQGRVEAICALVPADFPEGMSTEEGTGDLVAPPEAWAYFERVFTAFGLELPQHVNAQAAVAATVYLAGNLASNVKLRVKNERVYGRVKELLTPLERQFIDALFSEDSKRVRELAMQLRVLDKRMSDFV